MVIYQESLHDARSTKYTILPPSGFHFRIFSSWLVLYWTAAFLVCMIRVLFPLTLVWLYLGIKCWSLHISLKHTAVLAVSNSSFVFF
jgi:hypothetical protein